jgi:hypothetical protein
LLVDDSILKIRRKLLKGGFCSMLGESFRNGKAMKRKTRVKRGWRLKFCMQMIAYSPLPREAELG